MELISRCERCVFRLLLTSNASVVPSQGRTPLMRAAECGFVEGVQTLLDANADPNLHDLQGNSCDSISFPCRETGDTIVSDALFACLSDGTQRQQQCFSRILSHSKTNVADVSENGKSLLISACEKGLAMERTCLNLLERGANIQSIDRVMNEKFLIDDEFRAFRKRVKPRCTPPVHPVWSKSFANFCNAVLMLTLATINNKRRRTKRSFRTSSK